MFEKTAQQQRSGELLFSTIADMMASVVCQIRPSIHAAYRHQADEIASTYRGMMIAVGEKYWTKQFAGLAPLQMVRVLIAMANRIRLSRYAKNRWHPKKNPDKKMNKNKRNHVSTANIRKKRNEASKAVRC